MRHIRLSSVLALALAVLLGSYGLFGVASARANDWCFDDPVLNIGGTQVSIIVGVDVDPSLAASVVRSASIVVSVPEGTDTSLLSSSGPFPENVRIEKHGRQDGDATPVKVTVSFDATSKVDAALTVTYGQNSVGDNGSTRGRPLEVELTLPRS